MVVIFIFHCPASLRSWGVRIMVPSSFMISQQSPHSLRPARRIRSTVASVCPARSSTPFFLAASGNMWPGRRKSSGRDRAFTHCLAVTPRSAAEMPVEVLMWSMETVKAVSWLSELWDTIWGSLSLVHSSMLMGMQIRPLPCTAMKFTFSVVACWAAQIKSPSFSLFSSSVTSTIFPWRSSSSTSSMVLNPFMVLNSSMVR